MKKQFTIIVTGTVPATVQSAVNAALLTVPEANILGVDFSTEGTQAAPRYSVLIKYFLYT